jgi:hypothetical protein
MRWDELWRTATGGSTEGSLALNRRAVLLLWRLRRLEGLQVLL